jgi:hypothetical protein
LDEFEGVVRLMSYIYTYNFETCSVVTHRGAACTAEEVK